MRILRLIIFLLTIGLVYQCNVEDTIEEILEPTQEENILSCSNEELSDDSLSPNFGYICAKDMLLDFTGLKYYVNPLGGGYGWGPEDELDQLELGQVSWEKGVWFYEADEEDPMSIAFWTKETDEIYPDAESTIIIDNPEIIQDENSDIILFKGNAYYRIESDVKKSIGPAKVKMIKE